MRKYTLEKAQRKEKPGMKASRRVHRELLFYTGIIDLLTQLNKARGVRAHAQNMTLSMDRIITDLERFVDKAIGAADESLDACKSW